MRFVIYKNSILATICSLFGAAFIAMAIMSMYEGELGILPGIGVIAAGAGLMFLASVISDKKEERRQAKAASASAAKASTPNTTSYAQPRQASNTVHAQPYQAAHTPQANGYTPVAKGTPAKGCAIFAGICLLLTTLFSIITCAQYSVFRGGVMADFDSYIGLIVCVVMMLFSFFIARSHKVCAVFAVGFFILILINAGSAWGLYQYYGSEWVRSYNSAMVYYEIAGPVLQAVAYVLLLVIAIFAARKEQTGVIGAIWFVPVVLLVAAFVKRLYDMEFIMLLSSMRGRWVGILNTRPEFLYAIASLLWIISMGAIGFCCQRICSKPAVVYAQPHYTAAPEPPVQPRYTAPEPPVQPKYTVPEPPVQPKYTAPEPPVQPEPAAEKAERQDVQKQMRAYKDLLECGILTQEEYDQKIRELMRG